MARRKPPARQPPSAATPAAQGGAAPTPHAPPTAAQNLPPSAPDEELIDLDAEADDDAAPPTETAAAPDTDTEEPIEGGVTAEHRQIAVRRDIRTRLDVYLHNRLKGISRSRIQRLIDLGGVRVNDRPPKHSTPVKTGDVIDIILPPRAVRRILPEPIPLHVLYEDEHFIVINKQAGLIVHPARSNLTGTLLNALAHHFKEQVEAAGGRFAPHGTTGFANQRRPGEKPSRSTSEPGTASPVAAQPRNSDERPGPTPTPPGNQRQIPNPKSQIPNSSSSSSSGQPDGLIPGLSPVGAQTFRPGIIHRLDKNTTGVIVVAKSEDAHWGIARQFEDRTTLKAYLAVVHGNPDTMGGAVEQPIGKHPTIREACAVRHDSSAKHALTLYRVREQYAGYALVELELKTGRTHQIRVHMAYLGHPIVGDILYGGEPVGTPELDHPPTIAGARRFLSFAREKEEGQKIEAQARARPDLLMASPALHAGLLRFVHPITRESVTFTAPLHEPMLTLVRELRQRPATGPVAKEGWWIDLTKAVPK